MDTGRLHFRSLDDETCLVFDGELGATHLLSAMAAQVLVWIADGVSSREALLERLLGEFPEQSREFVGHCLDEALAQFVKLELFQAPGASS